MAVPIVIGCTFAGGPWFVGLVLVVAGLAVLEIVRLIERAGYTPSAVAACLAAAAFPLSVATQTGQLAWLLLAAAVAVGLMAFNKPAAHSLAGWALSVALALYVGTLFAPSIELRNGPSGLEWVILVLLATWACDTAAFLVGRQWGRHPVAPTVSPRKSVEGVAAGLGAAVLVAAVSGGFFDQPLARLLGLGVTVGCGAVLGDLAESALKRQLNAKDSGWMMPGHGGMLDRIDSLLVASFLGYFYVSLTHWMAPL